ncbi:hypothetical protein B566_EDAN002838, partial [Ephemera danica]
MIYNRNRRPWLFYDWIYKLTSNGRKHDKYLRILHGFTDMVIRQRKEELRNRQNSRSNDENDIGKKRRVAFLDLLLTTSEKDPSLTDKEIRAEVDTFMFEGHDTTAMSINWTLYFLSVHQDIQSRCVEELEEIFNGSTDRDPNITDLGNMKYLERVIKESLRLRPPVRYIGRKVHTNIKFGEKWHSRRKLLTPAFHFSILDQFLPIFCDKTRILVEKLQAAASTNPDGFDIVPYITRCTLDLICETAMGHSIDAQGERNSTYISNV